MRRRLVVQIACDEDVLRTAGIESGLAPDRAQEFVLESYRNLLSAQLVPGNWPTDVEYELVRDRLQVTGPFASEHPTAADVMEQEG